MVAVSSAIVDPPTGFHKDVLHAGQFGDLGLRRRVTARPVGDDHPRHRMRAHGCAAIRESGRAGSDINSTANIISE